MELWLAQGRVPCLLVLGLAVTATGCAQESAPWHDPSKHSVQFVAGV